MFNNINWTTIIFATIVVIGAWLIPSPFQCNNKDVSFKDSLTIGIPDTIWVHVPPTTGKDIKPSATKIPVKDLEKKQISDIFDDAYFKEETKGTTIDGTEFSFISHTYPMYDGNKDSLTALIIHEWEIKPGPYDRIERVDTVTVFVLKEVPVPTPVPFFEKPEVLIPLTIVGTILTLKGIEYILDAIGSKF